MDAADRALFAAALLALGRGCCTHPDHVRPGHYSVDGYYSTDHWFDGATTASAEVDGDRVVISYSQGGVDWVVAFDVVGPWPFTVDGSPVYPQDPADTSPWQMLETGDTGDRDSGTGR